MKTEKSEIGTIELFEILIDRLDQEKKSLRHCDSGRYAAIALTSVETAKFIYIANFPADTKGILAHQR